MKKKASFVYSAKVENGKLPRAMSDEIARLLRMLSGRFVRITIDETRRRRSNNQNRYYWGVVIPLVVEMFTDAGNETDEMEVHEYLKEHVGGLKTVLADPTGYRRTVVKSSAKLDTMEFEVYLEKVRAWCAQFGVTIPLPNEEWSREIDTGQCD